MVDRPLAVLYLHPFTAPSRPLGDCPLRAIDFAEEGVCWADRLLQKVRGWNLDIAAVFLRLFPTPWASPDEEEAAVRRARAWVEARGLVHAVLPASESEAERYRRIAGTLEGHPADAIFCHLGLSSLLLERADLDAIRAEARFAPDGVADIFESPLQYAWASHLAYIHRVASGEAPSPRRIPSCRPAAGVPLPPRWGVPWPLEVSRPFFDSLRAYPPEAWGSEVLRRICGERPEAFHSLMPLHLGVELTNEDDLPRLRRPDAISSRPQGRMSPSDWEALRAAIRPGLGPVSIDLWDFGEPLRHPDAVRFVEEAARLGVAVDLHTNGLHLDAATAERLVEAGVDAVFVRLDAATPEGYGRVCGDAPRYADAVAGLERLCEAKRRRNAGRTGPSRPWVAVEITEMPETSAEIDAFLERYDRGAKEAGSPIEYAIVRHDCRFRERVRRDDGTPAPLRRFACRQYLEGPYVLWDGRIVPCRVDCDAEHPLGHVRDGLEKVWNSDAARALTVAHVRGEATGHALCGPCQEWYYGFR